MSVLRMTQPSTEAQRRRAAIAHARETAARIKAEQGENALGRPSSYLSQDEIREMREKAMNGLKPSYSIGGITVAEIIGLKVGRLAIHRKPTGVVTPEQFVDGNYVHQMIFRYDNGLKCALVARENNEYAPMGLVFDIFSSRSGHSTVVFRNPLLTDGMYASCSPLSAACYIRDVVRRLKRDDSLEAVLYSASSQ